MNRILYDNRCRCKEKLSITKKPKSERRTKKRKVKPIPYPIEEEMTSKTFQIKYHDKLSLTAKFLLNSFQNKYIYYAMDDILYTLKSSPLERDNLLAILYSPVLFLQNHFSIDFFDIWIQQVNIEEVSKPNKFLKNDAEILNQFSYITIQFFYQTKVPPKKPESFW